ncbi:MAG: NAD-dependent epimerase/dehydratase family protein, partial [Candidatus Aenigmarchaeota archaeon]|nr:NAD-dependent epimerase/dehydratase family protein [Candidatus Aenigmarchaeota archaeon]
EFIKGDITDTNILKNAFKDADYIIHLAAISSIEQTINDPKKSNDINITGTLNVLSAARDANVKRFLFASSASIYGNTTNIPIKENTHPNPTTPYAISKITGEYYCNSFHELYGLETVALRFFNVFGPRQQLNSAYSAVIPKFINAMLKDKRPTIYGDGEQSRDFIYIKDVVTAIIKATTAPNAAGTSINIATGKGTTLNELVNTINNSLGKTIKPLYTDKKQGDIKHSLADISLAKRVLDFTPEYTLDKGIEKTIEWLKSNNRC